MISFLYIGPKSCHAIYDIIQLYLCRIVKSYYTDHKMRTASQEGLCYMKIPSQKSGLLRRSAMTIQDEFSGFGDLTLPSLSGIVLTCNSSHHSLIMEGVTVYETSWIHDTGSWNNLQNIRYSFSTDSASFSPAPNVGAPRLQPLTK
jgi:hypothetical protein